MSQEMSKKDRNRLFEKLDGLEERVENLTTAVVRLQNEVRGSGRVPA